MNLTFEWESVLWPVEFTHLSAKNGYYKIPEEATLQVARNSEFKFSATLSGLTESDDFLDYKVNGKPINSGEIMYGEEIIGSDKQGLRKYMVRHFFPQSRNVGFAEKPPYHERPFTAKVNVAHIEESYIDDTRKTETILEFYLCGKINLPFPRSTYRKKHEKVSKTRDGIDQRVTSADISINDQSGSSSDFAFVSVPGFDFIVQYVDERMLPQWAHGIQIEYRRSFKAIPNERDRSAISEIIGFIVGTHLNKIGETHLDDKRRTIKKIATNPWGGNIVAKSQAWAQPPITFDHFDKSKLERVLNKLVPKYLEFRNALGLSDILWKYWIAQDVAVGTNLPIFSSALETLADNYLREKKIVKKYSQEEKDKYKELVNNHLTQFLTALPKTEYGKRLVNAINNPFNIGVGEKLSLFFETLGFQIGKDSVENEALKARNKMTHNAIDNTDVLERNKYTKLTEAYATLVNRCILAVLEFDEKYLDYYTVGSPEQNLKDNIGITT